MAWSGMIRHIIGSALLLCVTLTQLNAKLLEYTKLITKLHIENQLLRKHRIKQNKNYYKDIYIPIIPNEPIRRVNK